MENRVFILFFLIAVLSFLFTFVSAVMLHIRGKHSLSYNSIIWLTLFIATAVPIVNQNSMLELELFTDYTGGMRIELQSDGEILHDDIYLTKDAREAAAAVCALVSAGLMIVMTAKFSYGLADYFNNLHFLTKYSRECHDERIQEIFERAKKKAKVHRSISLRTMESNLRLSPCTCGMIFPAVYIGSDYLTDYSELRLELVFLHELIHIKHCDTALKLLTFAITSFFGLLPMSSRIKNAVMEDVEYRCDKSVLEIMGDGVRGEYIAMIIDVAERNLKDECRQADFLSTISRSGEMILSRYKFMKERRSRKSSAVYAFPVLVAAVTLNMAIMSVVSVKNIDDMGVDLQNKLLEKAVCEYLAVSDPHDVRESDIAGIYSIEFALSDYRELLGNSIAERYALTCTLNEGLLQRDGEYEAPVMEHIDKKITADLVPQIIHTVMFDEIIPPDSDESVLLREKYENYGEVMLLTETDETLVREYILSEYKRGNISCCFAENKIIDTRDITLFTGLRTLIFSDRLKSEDETVYIADNFAVISRDE